MVVGEEPSSPASGDVEAEGGEGGETFAVHLAEHGTGVEVVVDFDVGLDVVGAQDPSDVLHDPVAGAGFEPATFGL